MELYDVQITTELEEVIVLQVCANSESEAELTAISMVENGQADVASTVIVNCFTFLDFHPTFTLLQRTKKSVYNYL